MLPCDVPNEFIILGGKNKLGLINNVYVYDLHLETVHYRPSMLGMEHFLKGFTHMGKIYVIGEYDGLGAETCD